MKKNIIVTGITSAILSKLINKIDKNKYNILGITRNINKIINHDLNYIEGNICSASFIKNIIKKDIDIIIHGAAVTHSFNEKQYFDINFISTKLLVDEYKNKNPNGKFIFLSSRTAGLKSGGYGISKYQAEQYIINNLKNWLIIRPSEIFGTDKNEGIEKLITDAKTKKIIFCPANVKSKLYPININKVINRMFDIIFIKESNNEIISIKGTTGYTYIEFAKKISKDNKNKLFIVPIPKTGMYILKYMLKSFNIKSVIVPDQIDRLYAPKQE